jgi:hypothetical protein
MGFSHRYADPPLSASFFFVFRLLAEAVALRLAHPLLYIAFPCIPALLVPTDTWCRWKLLDRDTSWIRNPNPNAIPQNVTFNVILGTPRESTVHTVVFSIVLHQACLRAMRRVVREPTARNPQNRVPPSAILQGPRTL